MMDGHFINKTTSKELPEKLTWLPLEHQVWRILHQYKQKSGFAKILLGVSGGADSMALLEVFRTLQKILKFNLFVCHIHHGDNGVSQEIQFFRNQSLECVENYCCRYQLPFTFKKNLDEKLSSEVDFRSFRYKVFAESLLETGSEALCLAHHSDDLFETRLLRLIRGTGLSGLESMTILSRRQFETDANRFQAMIFRPFIEMTKDDLIQYCVDKNISYIQDPSNFESDYMRNFLRNEWLPMLENKQKGSLKSFARSLQLIIDSNKDSDAELLELIARSSNNSSVASNVTSNEQIVSVETNRMMFLSSDEKKRVVVLMLQRLEIRDFSAGQVNEILKHLDSSQKIHTFVIGSVVWNVDAKQISIRLK